MCFYFSKILYKIECFAVILRSVSHYNVCLFGGWYVLLIPWPGQMCEVNRVGCWYSLISCGAGLCMELWMHRAQGYHVRLHPLDPWWCSWRLLERRMNHRRGYLGLKRGADDLQCVLWGPTSAEQWALLALWHQLHRHGLPNLCDG